MGEGEAGGYRRVNGATCSLEGGRAYFKGVLGLAEGEDEPLPNRVMCWGVTPLCDHPARKLCSGRSPFSVPTLDHDPMKLASGNLSPSAYLPVLQTAN